MREFNLHIETDSVGRLNATQREHLEILIEKLQGKRINLYWRCDGHRVTANQIIRILMNINDICKKKNVIVCNEVNETGKHVTKMAKWFLKRTPIELYNDDRITEESYECLKCRNVPRGCSFESCLGNTAFLMKDSAFSLCPYATSIQLASICKDDDVTSLFDTDEFKNLISRQIQKRNKCKSECELFRLCHGGCPVQDYKKECDILENVKAMNISDENRNKQQIKQLSNIYRG